MRTPPDWMERLAAWLTPARQRQNLLGDFHESYRSPSAYLLQACLAIPLVAWSEIRRTVLLRWIFSDFMVVWVCIMTVTDGIVPSARWRLSPVVTGLLVAGFLVVLRAYRPTSMSMQVVLREVAAGLALGGLTSALLWTVWPQGAISFQVMALSGVYAFLLMCVLWAFIEGGRGVLATHGAQLDRVDPGQDDPGSNLATGPAFVIYWAFSTATVGYIWSGLGATALICVVAWRIYDLRVPADLIGQARGQRLRRRRDAFAGLWSWYLAPTIVAFVLSMAGSPMGARIAENPMLWKISTPYVLAAGGWFWYSKRTARRAVERLDEELTESQAG